MSFVHNIVQEKLREVQLWATHLNLPFEASSKNDTFVAARLWIDNPYWQGVPFYIRTGKRMAEKSTRIVVEFKNSFKKGHPKIKSCS